MNDIRFYTKEEIKARLKRKKPICDATLRRYVKAGKILIVDELSRKCKLYAFNINTHPKEKENKINLSFSRG